MNPAEIIDKFRGVANKVAAISLAINRPNQLSAPHSIVNAFKNVASIALASGLKFKLLNNLSAAGPAPSGGAAKPAEKKEEKKGKE
jgi:large subunit ribosomal protein LP0